MKRGMLFLSMPFPPHLQEALGKAVAFTTIHRSINILSSSMEELRYQDVCSANEAT